MRSWPARLSGWRHAAHKLERMQNSVMKVAIIGAGPRGLWASEELMEQARERGAAIDVTVFDAKP